MCFQCHVVLLLFIIIRVPLTPNMISGIKGKRICNSSIDIISGNFYSEKIDQDKLFYHKDIYTSLLRMTQILLKILFGVSVTQGIYGLLV